MILGLEKTTRKMIKNLANVTNDMIESIAGIYTAPRPPNSKVPPPQARRKVPPPKPPPKILVCYRGIKWKSPGKLEKNG